MRPVGAASPHAHAYPPQDSLAGVGGDVQEAFSQGENERKQDEGLCSSSDAEVEPQLFSVTGRWNTFVSFSPVLVLRLEEELEERSSGGSRLHHQHRVLSGQRAALR